MHHVSAGALRGAGYERLVRGIQAADRPVTLGTRIKGPPQPYVVSLRKPAVPDDVVVTPYGRATSPVRTCTD
jgi:hypothetical protein